ncbi:MAG TPA: c-type cytochrome [Gammaproteobacteria bacterium]|nr:c-type cytochrome [Gammaproteobacteria bacterium]
MKPLFPTRYHLSGAALAVLLTASPLAQAEISRGAVMASTCFACHGTDGKSAGAIPSIYGIPADSLIATMKAFREDLRAATVMNRHAKGYTDEEIVHIANYLSNIK